MGDGVSLDQSYDDFPRIEADFARRLDESLQPRNAEALFELVPLARDDGRLALDVGCGEGASALRLAKRFGYTVIGVDPVERHIELATAAANTAELADRVQFRIGTAEALPVEDRSVSLIWCSEALMFTDLDRTAHEFHRALANNGSCIVYQVFTGAGMTDPEATQFWTNVGSHASSMRPEDVERAMTAAGLILRQRIDFGSEWGEYGQETNSTAGRRLLHAARLLRQSDRYIAEFGRNNYDIMLTDCLWHVYRMIGKLHGAAMVFSREARPGR